MRTHLRPLGVWALLLAVAATATLPGQKPRKEDEDDPPGKVPAKKDKKEEEEAPAKAKVLDVEDDPKAAKTPARPAAVDLARAARDARDPDVKELFAGLATPHDAVTIVELGAGAGGVKPPPTTYNVKPIPAYAATPKDFKEALTLQPINRDGNPVGEAMKYDRGRVQRVVYYEQIAAEAVSAFVRKGGTLDRLEAGDQALSAVLRWHQSALELKLRAGEGWGEVEARLRAASADVLLLQISTFAESKAWDAAFKVTDRLGDLIPKSGDPDADPGQKRIKDAVNSLVDGALKDNAYSEGRFREIRERLRSLERLFPDTTRAFEESLKAQAGRLIQRAKQLVEAGKKSEAQDLLDQAEQTWPGADGLRKLKSALGREHRILKVGMADEPSHFTPGWAVTDSERRCMDLLFEQLVILVPDDQGRLYYVPSLAEGRPSVLPLGRRFQLPTEAKWGDGQRLTANDVRATVRWMKTGERRGRYAAWGDLLSKVSIGGDAHRVDLPASQGFLDPMALSAFKVLPARPKVEEEPFAMAPVGSGPFVLQPKVGGQDYRLFKENPFYGLRTGRGGLPRAQEIRVHGPADPVTGLATGKLDIAFDLTADQAVALRGNAGVKVVVPGPTAMDRRIYFLAANHLNTPLRVAELRVALALAIDREGLLEKHFRAGGKEKLHKGLSGPFPVGSWASDPKLQSPMFDAAAAKAKFEEAKEKLEAASVSLELLYPTGDANLKDAMEAMADGVSKAVPGLTLTPKGVGPRELHDRVEKKDYQLAYHHYDFPEGSLWLGPLLGQGNYLNYRGSLANSVETASGLRYFPEVKKLAHGIHGTMRDKEMPFVPLWQLDPIYAYRVGAVTFPPFDPRQPFLRAAEWK